MCFGKTVWNRNGTTVKPVNPQLCPPGKSIAGNNDIVYLTAPLYHPLAISPVIFTADMTTYYCTTIEEALRRAKNAGKRPGCFYGGITLRSGRRGLAVYRGGKVIALKNFNISENKPYRNDSCKIRRGVIITSLKKTKTTRI